MIITNQLVSPTMTIGPLTSAQQTMNFTGLRGNSQRNGYRAVWRVIGVAGSDRDIELLINGAATNIKRVTTRNSTGTITGDAAANNYINTVRSGTGEALVELWFPFPHTGARRLIHVMSTTYNPGTATIEFQFEASFLYNDASTEITQLGIQTPVSDAPAVGSLGHLYVL